MDRAIFENQYEEGEHSPSPARIKQPFRANSKFAPQLRKSDAKKRPNYEISVESLTKGNEEEKEIKLMHDNTQNTHTTFHSS